jgi:hypothetical protein
VGVALGLGAGGGGVTESRSLVVLLIAAGE